MGVEGGGKSGRGDGRGKGERQGTKHGPGRWATRAGGIVGKKRVESGAESRGETTRALKLVGREHEESIEVDEARAYAATRLRA